LEQCSSELTALYKASLVNGRSLTDLTGGFGIDCAFLSSQFQKVTYVEQQEELCTLALHNFPLLGLNHIKVVNENAGSYLTQINPVDCIFLDPARRDGKGGKTVAIADCEPNVKELLPLLLSKAEKVMIKLSPMLDLSLALNDLPQTSEIHIVSVENECKELILIMSQDTGNEKQIHCVNLRKNGSREKFTFNRLTEQTALCTYTSELRTYLYEPNASILKGGAYKSTAAYYKLEKLHPNSHLYTSDELIPDFPGRIFRIESSFHFNKKSLKAELPENGKANITVRNFPTSVAELRKRTKLKEGGDTYFFATTLADEKKVWIRCRKI